MQKCNQITDKALRRSPPDSDCCQILLSTGRKTSSRWGGVPVVRFMNTVIFKVAMGDCAVKSKTCHEKLIGPSFLYVRVPSREAYA